MIVNGDGSTLGAKLTDQLRAAFVKNANSNDRLLRFD
jgi:hypothetical protein